MIILRALRFDRKFTRHAHVFHGLNAIQHEVHEHLLQLDTVSHDPGEILAELGADQNRVASRLVAQQDNHFSNEFIYVDQFVLQRTLLEEEADPVNDVRRARYICHESRCGFACL